MVYANNASASELCQNCIIGLVYFAPCDTTFGYHPKVTKGFVVVNEQWRSEAVAINFWRCWDSGCDCP